MDIVKEKNETININGKDCAKILFVIGLEYNTYQNNLKVAEKLNDIISQKESKHFKYNGEEILAYNSWLYCNENEFNEVINKYLNK